MSKGAAREGQKKGPGQRQLRVGETVRHILAEILIRGELSDPRLASVNVSVSEVRMSPDLKIATVYVRPLGGEQAEETVGHLNHAAGFLRTQLGQRLSMRYTPELRFRADRSFDRAARIEELLRSPKVRRDLGDG